MYETIKPAFDKAIKEVPGKQKAEKKPKSNNNKTKRERLILRGK